MAMMATPISDSRKPSQNPALPRPARLPIRLPMKPVTSAATRMIPYLPWWRHFPSLFRP